MNRQPTNQVKGQRAQKLLIKLTSDIENIDRKIKSISRDR